MNNVHTRIIHIRTFVCARVIGMQGSKVEVVHASFFFFREAVRVGPGQRFDERSLSMIDMSSRPNN